MASMGTSRVNYHFSNLCGTVYRQGNLVYSPDGNTLYSAVGNRVACFDLVRARSFTFPFEARRNIAHLALSPDGVILLTVDDEGHLLMANVVRRVVVHHLNLKHKVGAVRFSPDGRHVAFALGRLVQVWATPVLERSFVPFSLGRTLTGHADDVLCLAWSPDSLLLATGSRDMTVRVHPLHRSRGVGTLALTGHRSAVKAVFFAPSGGAAGGNAYDAIYSLSRAGALSVWELDERVGATADDAAAAAAADAAGGAGGSEAAAAAAEKAAATRAVVHGKWWELRSRHYLDRGAAHVTAAVLHAPSAMTQLLVVGFSTGVFSLYEMPSFNEVHTLSISEARVDAAAISSGGEWLAFGCSALGQLLVWEWQSESYVLRQQGHYFAECNAIAYSPGGHVIASGGGDAKVKLWSPQSGFCFVTFDQHTGPVTDLAFVPHGRALVSSSVDGTVRAFDTIRYRNFQTLVSPTPAQFNCVAVDPSGELVCAGSRDTLVAYVWNLQNAQLLESLSGHEAPISTVAFSAAAAGGSTFLATGSWDKSVRVWDFVSSKAAVDVLTHTADVLALAFGPDGGSLATATLDGQIQIWDAKEGELTGSIDGRADVRGGRSAASRVTAQNAAGGKCFRSLAFSADGRCILAGGNSKFVCMYDVKERVLLRKFALSNNAALDGVKVHLNSKRLTDAGDESLLLLDSDSDDAGSAPAPRGVTRRSERVTKLAVRAASVRFAPDGRSWAAASTEGLLIYSLDDALQFDPSGLELTTTPDAVSAAARAEEWTKALPMALCLNEVSLIRAVWQRVPPDAVPLVAAALPAPYLERMLRFLGGELDESRHIHAIMLWTQEVVLAHAARLRDSPAEFDVALRALHKGIRVRHEELGRVCANNLHSLRFLIDQMDVQNAQAAAAEGGEGGE